MITPAKHSKCKIWLIERVAYSETALRLMWKYRIVNCSIHLYAVSSNAHFAHLLLRQCAGVWVFLWPFWTMLFVILIFVLTVPYGQWVCINLRFRDSITTNNNSNNNKEQRARTNAFCLLIQMLTYHLFSTRFPTSFPLWLRKRRKKTHSNINFFFL